MGDKALQERSIGQDLTGSIPKYCHAEQMVQHKIAKHDEMDVRVPYACHSPPCPCPWAHTQPWLHSPKICSTCLPPLIAMTARQSYILVSANTTTVQNCCNGRDFSTAMVTTTHAGRYQQLPHLLSPILIDSPELMCHQGAKSAVSVPQRSTALASGHLFHMPEGFSKVRRLTHSERPDLTGPPAPWLT